MVAASARWPRPQARAVQVSAGGQVRASRRRQAAGLWFLGLG